MILVDRSRYVRRMQHCQRAAWLAYHYDGVGMRPAAEALPLATGTGVHGPLQRALEHARDHDGEVIGEEALGRAIAASVATYKKKAADRGFEDAEAGQVPYVLGEQSALVEGLVWAAWRVMLPWLLSEFTIIAVEREETYVVGCDCGIGDGEGEPLMVDPAGAHIMHSAGDGPRECAGVVIMSRPDFVAIRKSDGALCVFDFKTSSYAPRAKEHQLQFAFGCLGVERREGREVSAYYVVTMLKGKRDFASQAERQEAGSIKKQYSPICYVYTKEADPPFDKAEVRTKYTQAKGWSKVPTWLSPVVQAKGGVKGLVLGVMQTTEVEELVDVSPPMPRPAALIGEILMEIVSEEREWAWKVGQVSGIDDPVLPQMIRRSWDCDDYYGRPCEFRSICDRHPGWERPQTLGKWVARVPHHTAEKEGWEKEQVVARGWSVKEEEEGDDV